MRFEEPSRRILVEPVQAPAPPAERDPDPAPARDPATAPSGPERAPQQRG